MEHHVDYTATDKGIKQTGYGRYGLIIHVCRKRHTVEIRALLIDLTPLYFFQGSTWKVGYENQREALTAA